MMTPFFVCGIDLGGQTRKTTGVCLLKVVNGKPKVDRRRCKFCQVIYGKDLFTYLKPYFPRIKTIAIDAPLTLGPGKGKMRLWEKFFSTRPFRRHRVNPIPPAAIWRLADHGREVVTRLGESGFVLDENLIEVFPTFAKKVIKRLPKIPCRNENQRDAFVCAYIAWCHAQGKTFWIGYRDGRLYLPSFTFWKKIWHERFLRWWHQKHPFKYKFLRIGGYP